MVSFLLAFPPKSYMRSSPRHACATHLTDVVLVSYIGILTFCSLCIRVHVVRGMKMFHGPRAALAERDDRMWEI
jgi:hypothetical protein